MELKHKSLHLQFVFYLLFCNIMVASSNNTYSNLKSLTEITINIVDMAKRNLTAQLSTSDPLTNTSNHKWYFGVSACWNTSLNEAERLDDDYTRLKILRRHAVALNISKKHYVQYHLSMEIGNLYRSIRKAKLVLGYSRSSVAPKQPVGPFNTKTAREEKLIDEQFLATLQRNLYLMRQDFSQKISTTV